MDDWPSQSLPGEDHEFQARATRWRRRMVGAQALREPLVWRSAQANTKPNPIKATEMQATTMMVSVGIVRSSECKRIIRQFSRGEFD
jgi:hypothetical protein